jgi:LCP family protein required for cell wall assembly
MNEWPADWFRDGKPAPSDGTSHAAGGGQPEAGGGGPAGAAYPGGSGLPGESTVQLSGGAAGAGAAGMGAGNGMGGAGGSRSAASPWPEQPPLHSGLGQHTWRPPPVQTGGTGRRRRSRVRLVLALLAALVAVALVLSVAGYFYFDSRLHRASVLVDYAGRPAASAGQNWLITGSDSRQGLTRRQERKYHTGFDIGGQRSDTILLLHIPANGGPAVLVSIPRDSYVTIPGYGPNKINAAYSFGGPKLLAQTLQNATGLRIDHYMGIGFGGLVNVVNAIGGVTMCFPHPLHDTAAGLNLKKGCQTLSGGQALSFVRTRHAFASQDLQREQNQRVFIKALLSKLTSPTSLANPFAAVPAALGSTDSLTVDQGTHLYQLLSVAFALRHPQTTTVPVANAGLVTPAGDAVQWDQARALQLFNDLKNDRRVPKSLLTGSHLAG